MPTLTVTAKGQVTLRREFLRHLGVRPGEQIIVEKLPDGRLEARAARGVGDISEVFDLLKREDRPSLSIEDMNAITAERWAGPT
jgi:hypothetical protein